MSKLLNENAIAQYNREGYYFPVRILDDEQVAANRVRLEKFEAESRQPHCGGTAEQISSAFHMG